MRNKYVGMLIVGIALLIGFLVWLFNRALTDIVNDTCTHGPTCPMWGTIDLQTNIGIALMVFVIGVGLYMIFFAKDTPDLIREVHREVKIVHKATKPSDVKKFDKSRFTKLLSELNGDEHKIFKLLVDNDGSMFQSNILKEFGYTKVKITRILDRLEGKGLIERKRRGMTNIVIVKY